MSAGAMDGGADVVGDELVLLVGADQDAGRDAVGNVLDLLLQISPFPTESLGLPGVLCIINLFR